jgi:holliday junction DNA helicase RuvA
MKDVADLNFQENMFYYLKGRVALKEKDFVVFDVQGVGYKVFVDCEFEEESSKETVIFCYMQKTEKENKLYGFKEKENLELFEKLIKMAGIGPKTALRIASIASVEELKSGIEREDERIMKKIFSIGKKKGQQVVLELSQKIIKEEKEGDASKILKNLGFDKESIDSALKTVGNEKNEEKRVEKALKILGKENC